MNECLALCWAHNKYAGNADLPLHVLSLMPLSHPGTLGRSFSLL